MTAVTTAEVISRIAGSITIENEDGSTKTYRIRKVTGVSRGQFFEAAERAKAGAATREDGEALSYGIAEAVVIDATPDEIKGWPYEAVMRAVSMATESVLKVQSALGKDGAAPAA